MPAIRPSSDLHERYNEISAFCHQYGEPVYITKNGTGDLAVLSIEAYERLIGRFALYDLLEKGWKDIREGRTIPAKEALSSIRNEILSGQSI